MAGCPLTGPQKRILQLFVHSGAIWGYLGLSGAIWDYTVPSRLLWCLIWVGPQLPIMARIAL